MTRHSFLKTKLPVIPYLVFDSRNSNKYHETVSGDFGKKRIVLSWTTFSPESGKKADGTITIFYNDTSKQERKWYHEIASCKTVKEYVDELNKLQTTIN